MPKPKNIPPGLMAQGFVFAPSQILETAFDLAIFEALKKGSKDLSTLQKELKTSERGTRILLNALVGLGFLNKRGNKYNLTKLSRDFLLRSSPSYIGDLLKHHSYLRKAWGHLTEVVKTGKPYSSGDKRTNKERFGHLVRGLFLRNYPMARTLARKLGMGRRLKSKTILDLGAGAAPWSIGFLKEDRFSKAVALDFPDVLKITREYTRNYGVESRFSFLAGDITKVDLGENIYDIAILAALCHSLGEKESRRLFFKLNKALVKGGMVIVIDSYPNPERTGPPGALIFAVNMLVNTKEGDTFSKEEYKEWLKEAGFYGFKEIDFGSEYPALVGIKRD